MKLFFVRHGESVANVNNIVSPLDTPLTDRGKEQSKATGYNLIDKKVTKIVCSPLLRTRQTAEIIAGILGISTKNIDIIDELQERRLGELEGLPRQHEVEFFYESDTDNDLESRKSLIDRMSQALAKIKLISEETKGNVVIVGHCISGFYLSQVAKGNLDFNDFEPIIHMDNGDIDIIS